MAGILAGLDVEVIAIAFLFAVLVGVMIVRPLLVSVLSQAPFIGGWLGSNVDAGLNAFEVAIQPAANSALGALSSTIDWLASSWAQITDTLAGFGELAQTAVYKITTLILPALEERVTAAWSAGVNGAEALAAQEVATAEAAASQLVAAARTEAANATAAALTEAQNLAAANTALAQGLFDLAEQAATAQVQGERDFVVGQVLGINDELDALRTQTAAALAQAEAALTADIGQLAGTLGGELERDVNDLLAQIKADKDVLTAALAGTAAGLAADIAAIKALECLKYCSPLADVGSFLNALDAGLLIAAVGYARSHPSEAVGFFTGQVLPFVKAGVGDVEALIGG